MKPTPPTPIPSLRVILFVSLILIACGVAGGQRCVAGSAATLVAILGALGASGAFKIELKEREDP
jgi:hypothetical protein